MALAGFDWIIVAILAFSTIVGFFVGFMRSILSVLVWIGAVAASMIMGPALAQSFSMVTSNSTIQLWLSYGVVFIVAVLVGWVVKLVAGLIFIGRRPGGMDQLLGALFGLIRGILLVIVLLWFAVLSGVAQTQFFKSGVLTPYFIGLTGIVVNMFPNASAALENSMSSLRSGAQNLTSGFGGGGVGSGMGMGSGLGGLNLSGGGISNGIAAAQGVVSQVVNTVKSNLSGI